MQGSSRHLTGFRSRLSGGRWFSPCCCGRFSRFGYGSFSRFRCGRFSCFRYVSFPRFCHGFNRGRQFRLGLFRSAMVTMAQRLDARSFCSSQLSVCMVSALVLEVFRNRFSCHGCSVAELSPSEMYNFGHSVTIHGPPRGGRTETYSWQPSTQVRRSWLRFPTKFVTA